MKNVSKPVYPCDGCSRMGAPDCNHYRQCAPWKEWFKESWRGIRAGARKTKEMRTASPWKAKK